MPEPSKDGTIDVAITCGLVDDPPGVINEVFGGEPLMVSLRTDHHMAGRDVERLVDLAHGRLGMPSETLFPAWALAPRQALDTAGLTPPLVVLEATDLTATSWTTQADVDWIMTTASLPPSVSSTSTIAVVPAQLVPYTLQWKPDRAQTAAVARFVHLTLTADLPPGWHTLPGHLHHPIA